MAGEITNIEEDWRRFESPNMTYWLWHAGNVSRGARLHPRRVTLQQTPHADLSVRNQLPGVVTWLSPKDHSFRWD
ncbi:MAG: hypothetical protein U1D30_02810 [Planctomycetota bacterium]